MHYRLYMLPVSLFISTLIVAIPASARVIKVPNDAATIQQAIDLAVDGDTVLVADGTWSGPGNVDLDFGGRAITVRSLDGPAGCVIDCFSLVTDHRGFWFHNGEGADSVLRGFTIDRGRGASGGGIRCNAASPTIIDCVIANCSATSYGGGVYGGNSSPRLIGCTIENCTANTGGGAYFSGGAPLLDGCTVTGNQALESVLPANGGGLYFNSSLPRVLSSVLQGNTSVYQGGGMSLVSSSALIGNCLIVDNECGLSGAGFHAWNSNVEASCLTMASNSAPAAPAIWCYDSTVTASDCIIRGAEAQPLIVTDSGDEPAVTSSCVEGGFPGTGNIDEDPLFCDGPAGPWYLGRTAAGQPADSPCLDAGSGPSDTIVFSGAGGETGLDSLTTCSDQRADDGIADMGWHAGPQTIGASIGAEPASGVLPFAARMAVTVENLTSAPRTAAGVVGLAVANGDIVSGWRSGGIELDAGETVETAWVLTIPALPALAGTNILDLRIEDATTSPHGDPPYPAAGHVVEAACTFEASWP